MAGLTVRSPMQMELDRAKAATMYLQGWTQAQIAQEMDRTPAQVFHDLKVVRQIWLDNSLAAMTEIKARELAKIDEVEKEAWEAWRESKKEHIASSLKVVEPTMVAAGAPVPGMQTKQTKREKRTGSVEYLNTIQWCIEQRLKIFGGYAPAKLQVDELDRMIEKEIERVALLGEPSDAVN